MSDYGVKETQCTRCGHREVCSLKTEFLEAQKAIDEVYVSRPFELHCKHYIPDTGANIR